MGKAYIEYAFKAYYYSVFEELLEVQYLNKLAESSTLARWTTDACVDTIKDAMKDDMKYLDSLKKKGMF